MHAEEAACHLGDLRRSVGAQPHRPLHLGFRSCPFHAPSMDGHTQALAFRARLGAVAPHEPPHRHSLGNIDVAHLNRCRGLKDDGAHRIPGQLSAHLHDRGNIVRIAGNEYRPVDVRPIRIVKVFKCGGHASTIGKPYLTRQASSSAPSHPCGHIMDA